MSVLPLLELGQALDDVSSATVDACTLNNVLNVVQLVALAAIVRLLRGPTRPSG